VSRLLERWSSADVATERPVVAIPVGSCEQHGPHLPLGTDTMIAGALAGRLAERRRDVPVLVGPALSVTSSGEHAGFAGTLSIGSAVTEATIVELARSADWASGLVLVNWHGGNVGAVAEAVATIRAEGRNLLSWWPRIADGDAHAGRTETSIILALHPELVMPDRAVAGDVRPLAAIAGELHRHGVGAVSPSGVLGDPSDATLGEGRDLLDTLTDDLVSAVDDARNTW
jgi:mycofactocin precursor peptide peptidase